MTAKRIVAFVLAALLVVAALLIRNGLSDDSSDSSDGTDQPASGVRTTVVCSTEFTTACDTLDRKKYDVKVESAGTTLDRLAKEDSAPPDVWITLDPFPAMVDVLRQVKALSPTAPTVTPVATDTPVLALATAVADAVGEVCAGPVTWRCAGANAGKVLGGSGEKMLPGIADPDTESNGLISFANAVAVYFSQVPLTTSLWDDLSFSGWLRTLRTSANIAAEGETPLTTLVKRRTAVNVAATTISDAKSSPQPGAFAVVPLKTAIPYVAVVATFGSKGKELAAVIGSSLLADGWTAPTGATPPLSAGTFVALRTLWRGR